MANYEISSHTIVGHLDISAARSSSGLLNGWDLFWLTNCGNQCSLLGIQYDRSAISIPGLANKLSFNSVPCVQNARSNTGSQFCVILNLSSQMLSGKVQF